MLTYLCALCVGVGLLAMQHGVTIMAVLLCLLGFLFGVAADVRRA